MGATPKELYQRLEAQNHRPKGHCFYLCEIDTTQQDWASDAGANQIGSLYFSLKDPRTSRQEAIATAAKHAIEDARTLAAASGVSLASIRQLSLDGANLQPPRPIEYKTLAPRAMVAMDFEASAAPDIAGGTVTVTANVTAEWMIDQLHRAEPATSQTQD